MTQPEAVRMWLELAQCDLPLLGHHDGPHEPDHEGGRDRREGEPDA